MTLLSLVMSGSLPRFSSMGGRSERWIPADLLDVLVREGGSGAVRGREGGFGGVTGIDDDT